jgi:hypothetical protein
MRWISGLMLAVEVRQDRRADPHVLAGVEELFKRQVQGCQVGAVYLHEAKIYAVSLGLEMGSESDRFVLRPGREVFWSWLSPMARGFPPLSTWMIACVVAGKTAGPHCERKPER